MAVAAIAYGRAITRFSARFTRSTSATCWASGRNRWITPRPPARAIAIAIRASVTVSMFAAITGDETRSPRVTRAEVSTSDREPMLDRRGTSRTSS